MTIYCPAAPPPYEAFITRDPLPSCGTFAARRADDIPARYRECMTRGQDSGIGAELAVMTRTAQGDPITTYYRVTAPGGRAEAFVDHSAGRSGSAGWDHYFCALLTPTSESTPRCPGVGHISD